MTGEYVVFLNGFFNIVDPIFHWQLYLWLCVFFGIIGIASYAGWYYGKWMPFKPLHGLYYAAKAGSDAAFVCGPQLYFTLNSEAEAKCIFDYGKWGYDLPPMTLGSIQLGWKWLDAIRRFFFNYATAFPIGLSPRDALTHKLAGINDDVKIAKALQGDEWEGAPSVTVGTTPTDIILDTYRWIDRASPQHKIIEDFALKWNRENPRNQIHSYSKFLRLMELGPEAGGFEAPSGLVTEVIVPWERIDASFPLKLQDNEMAGYRGQLAAEEAEEEKDQDKNLGIKILLGVGIFAAVIYAGRFASFAMSLPPH
jgi:hypothetical protein